MPQAVKRIPASYPFGGWWVCVCGGNKTCFDQSCVYRATEVPGKATFVSFVRGKRDASHSSREFIVCTVKNVFGARASCRHCQITSFILVLIAIDLHAFDQHCSALSGLASHVCGTQSRVAIAFAIIASSCCGTGERRLSSHHSCRRGRGAHRGSQMFVAMMLEWFDCHK